MAEVAYLQASIMNGSEISAAIISAETIAGICSGDSAAVPTGIVFRAMMQIGDVVTRYRVHVEPFEDQMTMYYSSLTAYHRTLFPDSRNRRPLGNFFI